MTTAQEGRHGSLPTTPTATTANTATTAAAIAGLTARDTALAALSAVLDPGQRCAALDAASHITRLRYKPGSSVVASLAITTSSGDTGTGWIAAYADPTKAHKTLARAHRSGFSARAVDGVPGVLVGETCADRMLSLPLAEIRALAPDLLADATVLRHNPHRRVVFRSRREGTPVVLKVSAADGDRAVADACPGGSAARQSALNTLERGGVAVLRPRAVHGVPGVETVPWWGDGDLATLAVPGAADTAGQQLAVLHNARPADFLTLSGGVDHGAASRAAAQVIATILPQHTERAAHLAAALQGAAAALPPRRHALVHGDFSPDQVLVGSGDVRLIDFDRAGIDYAERDLGAFAASAELLGCPALADKLLTGYTDAGATFDNTALHLFTALALMQRSVEPFRAQTHDWAAQTARILDLVEREVALC